MSSAFEGWGPPAPCNRASSSSAVSSKTSRFAAAFFPRPAKPSSAPSRRDPGAKGRIEPWPPHGAGARTRFIGAVGRDAFGAEAARFHRSEGIDARLAAKKGMATGAAAILVDRASQNEIIVALGQSAAITPRDVPPALLLRGARVVICQGRPTRGSSGTPSARPAIRRDHNPQSRAHGPGVRPGRFLGLTDVLIPNESEFSALTRLAPETDPEAVHAQSRALGVATVIVTLGCQGCVVSTASGHTPVAAHRSAGGRHDRGRRRVRGGVRQRPDPLQGRSPRGGAVRKRRRRGLGHAPRHGALDALPRRDRPALKRRSGAESSIRRRRGSAPGPAPPARSTARRAPRQAHPLDAAAAPRRRVLRSSPSTLA